MVSTSRSRRQRRAEKRMAEKEPERMVINEAGIEADAYTFALKKLRELMADDSEVTTADRIAMAMQISALLFGVCLERMGLLPKFDEEMKRVAFIVTEGAVRALGEIEAECAENALPRLIVAPY